MNIKKLLLVTTIIGISLGFSSCNPFNSSPLAQTDEEIADVHFQKIIKAIEKKDKEGLKKLFSSEALKKAKDIDNGIEYIFQFYKGKIKSKEGTVVTSDSKNNGKKTSELECYYTVTTDEDTYIVFFIDQIVDNQNPDNVGLYMLQIIKQSDEENEFDWGGDKTRCAGIYRPAEIENK